MDFWSLLISDIGPMGILAGVSLVIMVVVSLFFPKDIRNVRGLILTLAVVSPLAVAGLTAIDLPVTKQGLVAEKTLDEGLLGGYYLYVHDAETTLRTQVWKDDYFKVAVGNTVSLQYRKFHRSEAVTVQSGTADRSKASP